MPFIGKVVILFLIIFNFRVPVLYNSTALSIMLCLSYYIWAKKSIPFNYFFRRYNVTLLFGALFLVVISVYIATAHLTYENTMAKIMLLQLFMMAALTFALPILIQKEDELTAFEQCSKIICYAFALQGLIQLTGFLIPPVGDYLISIKPDDIKHVVTKEGTNEYYRGYALAGQPFFELPAGFGLAFIILFRILLTKGQQIITGYKVYIMIFLFSIGSMLSGRTAFVGLLLGILMSLFAMDKPVESLLKVIRSLIIFAFISVAVYALVLSSAQRKAVINDVFPFAFEFYYNYRETGKFRTASTDVMIENHYFAISQETLWKGDGMFDNKDGSYYMNTDAGYMRYLLFGGIPFLICLIIYVVSYFLQPISIARRGDTREDHLDFLCLLTLLIHLFVLNYKGTALGTQNIMQVLLFFIGSSYMIRDYAREDRIIDIYKANNSRINILVAEKNQQT